MMPFENVFCDDEERRSHLAADDTLNGIDFVEVITTPALNQRALDVFFIPKTTVAGQAGLSTVLNDLAANPTSISITGGVRTRNIKVTTVARLGDRLRVHVSEPGDFSDYTLNLNHPALDSVYAQIDFNFKVGCPSHFDCKPRVVCPPEPRKAPLIDYMAKDYASFRQALLDLIPTLVPQWKERHAADLGITLVELLAYAGDYLSYYQDAVSNEAYLETARQRISVRRLARLIDYRMHDGASARAFVHFNVQTSGALPAGTQLLTLINVPLGSILPPLPAELTAGLIEPALAATDAVFETMTDVTVHQELNEIRIYTWGNHQCCLPRGVTQVDLLGDLNLFLKAGDFLLFEEVVGPETLLVADADPTHRQIVRLTKVEDVVDPLLPDPLTPTRLTRVTWDRADALKFPLCVSVPLPDGTDKDVSLARGNLVLADHGRTMSEWFPGDPAAASSVPGISVSDRAFRFRLREGPLSFRIPLPEDRPFPASVQDLLASNPQQLDRLVSPCLLKTRQGKPQVQIKVRTSPATTIPFEWMPDLLDSREFSRDFTVETDNDGRAVIRFGDGTFGQAPPDRAHIEATYRVGIGTAGRVGADSLVHVVNPGAIFPSITSVRNPLPAFGGVDPESIAHVKQIAPAAFRSEQYRAVTEADYARAAEKHPQVSKAVATFRWTGSWHTVFLTIDPLGGNSLTAQLKEEIRNWVTCYTQAGYDLEIDEPIYVPLDIEINVCTDQDQFRGDVEKALLLALSNQTFLDGSRGFFHPDIFSFGQPVYLSRLYAAIEAVTGVASAVVVKFKRFGKTANNELDQAFIPLGRLEVARLDNDPSFPENGVLKLKMLSGK
jgi:hypothetical protein